jgi:hypothetical protein
VIEGPLESLQERTVYLAGPMRGYPRYNFDAFLVAAGALRAEGIEVVSPAEMDLVLGFDPDRTLEEQGFDVEEALRRDFDAIATVEGIVFMEGSEKSAGALAEYEVAKALVLPVFRLERTVSGGWALSAWSYAAADHFIRTGRRLRVVA